MPRTGTFRLTPDLVAAHGGGPVVCLDLAAIGRTYRLHAERSGAQAISRLTAEDISGGGRALATAEPIASVMRVDIRGPIEQRAGYHDLCSGWTDGYDAIVERMSASLAMADVICVFDTPGGAAAGIGEGVRRILKAKKEHGRRITGYIDEQCASAGYWIAAAICDEIYGPRSMSVGSIGVRSAWYGCAGALSKSGLEVAHFAFPAGKTAFAAEQALSETARSRAMRDVMHTFDAFAAAVGPARGLSREEIEALDADCLGGDEAVAARLVDGIASLEDVVEYALALASGEETVMRMRTKLEDEEEKKDEEEEEKKPEAAEEEEDEKDEEEKKPEAAEDEEEAAPSSKPAALAARGKAAGASLASLAGLPAGASDLAIRTSLHRRIGVYAHAAKLTGEADPGKITGALDAIAQDAAASARLRTERDAATRAANAAERMNLLRQLSAAGVHTRGELFADVVDGAGKRTGIKPAKLWGPGRDGRTLENLRGYTAQALAKSSPGAGKRSPFEPDAASAERAAQERASGKPSAAAIEAAKKHPDVIAMFNRPGNTHSVERLAEAYAGSNFAGGFQ